MAGTRKTTSPDVSFLIHIYTEAFKRIGKTLAYQYNPAKRATFYAISGKTDGELARVYNYNDDFPELIRVDEPLATIRFSAFTTSPQIKLNGWESLSGTPYRVEYIRGERLCEKNLTAFVNPGHLSTVSDWLHALKKLAAGRTDVVVSVEGSMLKALSMPGFRGSGIHLAGVMEQQTVHAFFHEKYKDLSPQLSNALKDMKQEGAFEKILRQYSN